MTHDELIAFIDDQLTDCGPECDGCEWENKPWNTLRQIIELHKPTLIGPETERCLSDKGVYPCPTILTVKEYLLP